MRVAMVGAGLQARRRGPVLVSLPDVEVVAVGAAHLDSAKRMASRLGCEAFEGWEPIVERSDLDAIIVATPPNLHARISIAAMRRGMHVLCEKPLARTIEEGDAMVLTAKQTGRVLKCGFNHRYHPAIRHIRMWFEEGQIGAPIFVRALYGIGGRPGFEVEWRANPEVVGGGQLMEQGIHVVDLARWFLGKFADVTALVETRFWKIQPLEDNAFASYRTANGVVAFIHSSLTQWKNLFSFELFGSDGYVRADGLGGGYGIEKATLGRRDFTAPFSEETIEFRGEDRSWHEEWKDFVSAIESKREPLGTGLDGLEAMRLVFAAYSAARTGRAVNL